MESPMAITQEEIYNVIVEEANVSIEALVDDTPLASLGIASLDVIGISFILEDRYGLILDPNAISPTSTVGDLVRGIQALEQAKETI